MKMEEFVGKLKNDKKMIVVVCIGIIGVLILMFLGNDSTSDNENDVGGEETTTSNVSSIDDIENKLETKLTEIISEIEGVGEVRVVVTVASSDSYIFAENIKSDNDTDSFSSDREIIIYKGKDGDDGLKIGIRSPDVLGVAVVCQGATSSVVKSEITGLVTSLFGIGSDRVYVGNMS